MKKLKKHRKWMDEEETSKNLRKKKKHSKTRSRFEETDHKKRPMKYYLDEEE